MLMVKKKKKRVVKKSPAKKNVLREALGDISKELVKLRRERGGLSKKVGSLDSRIVEAQNMESQLRDRISRLVATESNLTRSKGTAQTKLLALKQKLAKIKKIQEELRDV